MIKHYFSNILTTHSYDSGPTSIHSAVPNFMRCPFLSSTQIYPAIFEQILTISINNSEIDHVKNIHYASDVLWSRLHIEFGRPDWHFNYYLPKCLFTGLDRHFAIQQNAYQHVCIIFQHTCLYIEDILHTWLHQANIQSSAFVMLSQRH